MFVYINLFESGHAIPCDIVILELWKGARGETDSSCLPGSSSSKAPLPFLSERTG